MSIFVLEIEVTTTIGDRLILIRGDLSQATFSSRLGVSKNSIGNWERGDRIPDAIFLQKLVSAGYDSNWVVAGIGSMRLDTIQASESDLQADELQWLQWYRKVRPEDRTIIEPMVRGFAERYDQQQEEVG